MDDSLKSEAGDGFSEVTNESSKSYTDHQLKLLTGLYTIIAQAMPVEGRDYKVMVKFNGENGGVSISLKGITEIGIAFSRHLIRVLNDKGRIVRDGQ